MSTRDEQFLDFYQQYRYQDQVNYYKARKREFEDAQNEFINISTVLMILAALMGVLASVDLFGYRLWWAVLAVVFPTLSAALSTYNNLYAFERQAKIYQDAAHRLGDAWASSPHVLPVEQESDYHQAIVNYVEEVEKVFAEERGQWGQLADDIKPVQAPLPDV